MHKIKLPEKYSWPESLHINQPWTIGQAMSSGCIRMANDDVKHLYANVDIGTKVIVLRQNWLQKDKICSSGSAVE